MSVKILDCTLRDGGYVNSFAFSNIQIQHIASFLNSANIDIIECGFLDEISGKAADSSRFNNIDVINTILNRSTAINSLHVAMVEYGKYDVVTLPMCTQCDINKVNGIRLSFRKSDHNKIFDDVKTIIDKGYKLFIQPIATDTYSDNELISFIQRCNQHNLFSFYIVDTHGSMHRDNLRRLYYLINHNLSDDVVVGFHSHNNLQLSYSNSIDLIEINKFSSRNIIIDSSVFGMGRGAGNLNTELLAGYLNNNLDSKYNIENILEIMDKYLLSLRQQYTWGYSLEHYLSATLHCHPDYASFLIDQKNLDVTEIKLLLDRIPSQESREYNRNIIDDIYIKHKESINLETNYPSFDPSKKIMLIGSGSSVKEYIINKKVALLFNESIKISLNHPNEYIDYDYIFFTNQVRYNEFCSELGDQKIIVTSNIKVKSKHLNSYVLDYKDLFEYNDVRVDNVALLMLNYLGLIGVKEVSLMGLDGFSVNNSYSYIEDNRVVDKSTIDNLNDVLAKAYHLISQNMNMQFITPSLFKKHVMQKVIGVIPARYSSTRLPGKPLKDICGLPMIIHVLRRAQLSQRLDELYVATDDARIFQLVENYGGNAVMTDEKHSNATERVHEVSQKKQGDIYVIINGDEPLLTPEHIDILIDRSIQLSANIAMLYNEFYNKNSPSDQKVVVNKRNEIMYISRSDIPSDYIVEVKTMYKAYFVVSFTKEFLDTYVNLENTPLSDIESNEFTKVLEHGYVIQGVKVNSSAISVDTEEDLKYVRDVMENDKQYLVYKG